MRRQRHLAAIPSGSATEQTTMEDFVDLFVHAVGDGVLDHHLERVAGVVRGRMEALRAAHDAQILDTLAIGDRVRITHPARPAYLLGQTGTVAGRMKQSILVRLDHPVGRFDRGEIRCPPRVLERLGPQPL